MWDDQYGAFGVIFYPSSDPVDKAGFHLIDRFDEWELVEVGHRKTSLADERKLLGLMPYNPSFALRVQAVRDQIDDLIAKYDISKSDIF